MALTTAQKATVTTVINYLAGNYEKPIDEWAVDRLSKLHVAFGYDSEIVYREALRDAPHSTLLKSLLAVAA